MSADVFIASGQAAKLLGVTPATVTTYLRQGHLEGVQLPSGHWRVTRESVDQLLRAGSSEVTP